MAQILIKGFMATVELIVDPDDDEGGVLARCIEHSEFDGRLISPGDCTWAMPFSSWSDAICTPFAEHHADTGRQ